MKKYLVDLKNILLILNIFAANADNGSDPWCRGPGHQPRHGGHVDPVRHQPRPPPRLAPRPHRRGPGLLRDRQGDGDGDRGRAGEVQTLGHVAEPPPLRNGDTRYIYSFHYLVAQAHSCHAFNTPVH